MNNLKKQMDEEMKKLSLSEEFGQETVTKAKENPVRKKKKFPMAVAAMLAVVFVGTTSFAGYQIYQRIQVNGKDLPELEAMEIQEHEPIRGTKEEESGAKTKAYPDYAKLKEDIKVPLLDTKYADAEFQEVLYHEAPQGKYELIRVLDYIPDKRDGKSVTGYEIDGTQILSAISMNIYLALDETALETELNDEYVGEDFSFVEQYISRQGYKVNVIKLEYDPEWYIAIFVADGVRYELYGVRELEEIKEVVDSMSYE